MHLHRGCGPLVSLGLSPIPQSFHGLQSSMQLVTWHQSSQARIISDVCNGH